MLEEKRFKEKEKGEEREAQINQIKQQTAAQLAEKVLSFYFLFIYFEY